MQYPKSTLIGGRYEVDSTLGSGGFATTYRARDSRLGRMVAVKVLHDAVGADPDLLSRFEREARAAAQLSSPFVVPVYDFGIEGARPYLIMQLMPGGTLRDRLDEDGPLPPAEAVAIAADMLRGLQDIHAQGIVHRDIKPANVLFGPDGVPRLSDFGIAYLADATVKTRAGSSLGTPAYMAPEQAHGQGVGPAADLYATGVVLFEMLTGRTPFAGLPFMAQMMAQVNAAPPLPSEVAPGLRLPVPLEREVMRALAKSPGDRRPSAAAMADALLSAAHARSPALPAPLENQTTRPIALGPGAVAGGRAQLPPTSPRFGWVLPVGLLVAALAIVALVFVVGDLGRLILGGGASEPPAAVAPGGNDGASSGNELAVGATETPLPTLSPEPTPEIGAGLAEPTTEPAATIGVVATAASDPPTPIPTDTPVPTPTATAPPVPTVTATAPPMPTLTPTEVPAAIAWTPTPESLTAVGAIQFAASEWRGARPAPAEFARDAVILYGADSPSNRATLRFTFDQPPTGRLVLTVQGLGDETTMAFPYGIEVNGMYVGESPAAFANFSPGRDGRYGEQAEWDSVRIVLPAAVFQAGENEISLISLMPGDYDGRPPSLLLGSAELAPE